MTYHSESISALLPVRNGEIFFNRLKENITSLLGPHDELVVIDDDSTDDSYALFRNWSELDSRISLFRSPSRGLVDALNFGVKVAKHRWIGRVDVDDLYDCDRFRLQLPLLLNGSVVVFSDYKFLASGRNLGTIESAIYPSCTSLSLISGARTPHSSAMFDREAFLAAGSYRREDFPAEDLSLWLRMSRTGKMATVPATLLNYTLNPGGISQRNQIRMNNARDQVLREIGINSDDVRVSIETWSAEIDKLWKSPSPGARSLLLLRDILMYEKRFEYLGQLREVKLKISSQLLNNPAFWSSGVRHMFWKMVRKIETRRFSS